MNKTGPEGGKLQTKKTTDVVILVSDIDGIEVMGPSIRKVPRFGRMVPAKKVPRGIEAKVSMPVRDILFNRSPIRVKNNPAILDEIEQELERNVLKKVYDSKPGARSASKRTSVDERTRDTR